MQDDISPFDKQKTHTSVLTWRVSAGAWPRWLSAGSNPHFFPISWSLSAWCPCRLLSLPPQDTELVIYSWLCPWPGDRGHQQVLAGPAGGGCGESCACETASEQLSKQRYQGWNKALCVLTNLEAED